MVRMSFACVAAWAAVVIAGASIANATPALTTIATFNGTNGSSPDCGLIADSQGNLYGTTYQGGLYGSGTVFELPVGGSSVTTCATFSYSNGSNPEAGLVADGAGNLYGTTYSGGQNGVGTVFRIPSGGGSPSTLTSFNSATGNLPNSTLVFDASGNLYGTASGGGQYSDGTVFMLPANGGSMTNPVSFNGSNGAQPEAGLLIDEGGNLYGTTMRGGSNNVGTVFEVKAGSGTITTLAAFSSSNGAAPSGRLIADSAGNFCGTTSEGGANNDGTVFELPAGSSSIITLATFNGANGARPLGGLIADAAGNLFGTTFNGGANGDGTVFEVPAGGGPIITLATFDLANGSLPNGDLIADADGNLYGTTSAGGTADSGTIFELTDTGFVTTEPEPASFSLLGIAGFALLRRRTRKGHGISC